MPTLDPIEILMPRRTAVNQPTDSWEQGISPERYMPMAGPQPSSSPVALTSLLEILGAGRIARQGAGGGGGGGGWGGTQNQTGPIPSAPIMPVQQPIQQPMVLPQQQQNPQIDANQPKPMSPLMQSIIQALPMLLAAGVGLGSKGALPGAAGFAEGYGTGLEKAQKNKLELEKIKTEKAEKVQEREDKYGDRNVHIYDEKTGKIKKYRLSGKDLFRMANQGISKEEIGSVISGLVGSTNESVGNQEQLIKPDNIPQELWDSTTDQQKQEFLNSINAQ